MSKVKKRSVLFQRQVMETQEEHVWNFNVLRYKILCQETWKISYIDNNYNLKLWLIVTAYNYVN